MKDRTRDQYASDFRQITKAAEEWGLALTDNGWSVSYVEVARLNGLMGSTIVRHLYAAKWRGLEIATLARKQADHYQRQDPPFKYDPIELRDWCMRILNADPDDLADSRSLVIVSAAVNEQLSGSELATKLNRSTDTIRAILRKEGRPRGTTLAHIRVWGRWSLFYGYRKNSDAGPRNRV